MMELDVCRCFNKLLNNKLRRLLCNFRKSCKEIPYSKNCLSKNKSNLLSSKVYVQFNIFIFLIIAAFSSISYSPLSYSQSSIKSITIISDNNYPPYIFKNEKGELQGIIVDQWKLWEMKTGIKANLLAKDWGKAYKFMLDNNADVLETVFLTEERSKIFEFTKPYATLNVPIFFHKTLSGITNVNSLRGFSIGVKLGDACIDILRKNRITTLKVYNSYEEIIQAAQKGDVRVFCIDEPPAIYYLYKYNLENEFKLSFTLYKGEFHRAVRKGNIGLLKIIENGFAKISDSEKESIDKKWLGTSLGKPAYFEYIIYSFSAICFIVLILTLINFILRKKVKEKTNQLEKAFKELSESEDKFRSIFENANEGICVTDNNDKVIAVNQKFADMTGYSVDELHSLDFTKFLNRESSLKFSENKGKKLSDKIGSYELKIQSKNDSTLWTLVSRSPFYNGVNSYGGIIEMFTDITERKNSEEEIRKLYRSIEQSPAIIIISDINGIIEYINPICVAITGYSYEEVLGHNLNELYSEVMTEQENQNLWETILSGNEWKGELHNKKKNGEYYWESTSISPVKNENGEVAHFIVIKEDITEKKSIIEDLIAAKERAEEMSRLKSSFLANMSHELRTPLVGILGFTDILLSQLEEPELKSLAEGIYRGSKRLSETLNLILDLSKAESNKIEVNNQEVDLIATVNENVKLFSISAEKKDIKLITVIKDTNITAMLDERLFSNILNNLINNAIKYTNAGSVIVEIGKEEIKETLWVYVKVTDTGIGISEENLEIIFSEFRQVSEGYGRSFEGTGLGLTITKKAVEVMSGQISVESKLGEGSVFTVKFPALPKDKIENKLAATGFNKNILYVPPVAVKEKSPLVLYVEDDTLSQEVVKLYLKSVCTIDIAANGNIAIEMLKEKKYDAFLIDINLGPGLNGLAVIDEIKNTIQYKMTPIIAVTAYAMKGDKEKLLSAGCTHYISKPFMQSELVNLLDKTVKGKV